MIAGWELALIIFAITVMIVNVVNVTLQIKLMSKFDRLFSKSVIYAEKWLDWADSELRESLKDED